MPDLPMVIIKLGVDSTVRVGSNGLGPGEAFDDIDERQWLGWGKEEVGEVTVISVRLSIISVVISRFISLARPEPTAPPYGRIGLCHYHLSHYIFIHY